MLIALMLTAALLASVPLVAFLRSHRPPRPQAPTDWQPCPRWFCTRVHLVDGTSTRSMYLMRRPGPDRRWQYRKMTRKEFEIPHKPNALIPLCGCRNERRANWTSRHLRLQRQTISATHGALAALGKKQRRNYNRTMTSSLTAIARYVLSRSSLRGF